ncbi:MULTISPECIES: DUF4125 family protein [unclassified Pseudodesulfovibrio]|uniref:DUF4125 family protein n=1 Tax=unclassified Pseudodesulfovibrio TaxID=2661612 RepID=UPI000FEB667F|nr:MULTISPECIES: DUF4125 family protein [unclassified Pseudodesulfovibrio]MCJ2163430.1 DUF4125 family protein [Pseudodesulfovibrio sp. S3-i]RWU06667.1 DUF4125 family protein [Pseudodesulfovibrio sp. S3]
MTIPVRNQERINQIVDIELEMFRHVNSTVHSPCQDHLNTFKTMRTMHHSVLPMPVLESYLSDLTNAQKSGRNLMTEKYARMENRIPPINESRHIGDIVDIETNWMVELLEKYPKTFEGSGEMFKTYLRCELETMSDQTLLLLLATERKAALDRVNMVEERYNNLFKGFGYKSLAERERGDDAPPRRDKFTTLAKT